MVGMLNLNRTAHLPHMSPASDRLPHKLNTEERFKFTHKIFDISQVADMIEYHRKTYNYNIQYAVIGELTVNESITFILE